MPGLSVPLLGPGGIEQLQERIKDDQQKIKEIECYDAFFVYVHDLYENLKQCKDQFEENEFLKSNYHIKTVFELYDKIQQSIPIKSCDSSTKEAFRTVCESIKSDIDLVQEKFICDFIQIYKNNFTFDSDSNTFNCDFNRQLADKYTPFIECLLDDQVNFGAYLENTCTVLTEHFLKPILIDNSIPIVLTHDGHEYEGYNNDFCAIALRTNSEQAFDDDEIIMNVKQFIKLFLQILTNNFTLSCKEQLSQLVGKLWFDQICSSLIKHYFELRLPKNELHFENFTETLKKGSTIIEFMYALQMLSSPSTDIFDSYLANVKDNFAVKVSQDLLIRVKRSLKSDLGEFLSSEEALKNCKALKFKTRLPKLMISKFMLNIQEIFEEMSALFEVSSTNLQTLLTKGFLNVCELFVDISPFVFKVNIERDPRQNALFHNNCLYFAYLVEGMVTTHKPLLNEMATYLPDIRGIASQIFINQMQYQEKILLSLIKDPKFSESLALIADEIPATDRKITSESHYEFRQCLNNCLKHLNVLHRAFDNVLPDKICGRAFNTLISSFLSEFIQSILSLNDITSLGAAHLSSELDYFGKELKQFLPNSEGLVSKWLQLNEINFILKSSMLEIVNRWADGCGVLANYLTADEVKHLIRALFQNNERRSNALSKIK